MEGLLEISDLAVAVDALSVELERLFIYALTWSVGGLLEIEDRIKFTQYIITTAGSNKAALPTLQEGDTFFEFRVNSDSMEWERWVAPTWEYPSTVDDPDFSSMLVPTVETTRASYILSNLHRKKKGALMTGSSGM